MNRSPSRFSTGVFAFSCLLLTSALALPPTYQSTAERPEEQTGTRSERLKRWSENPYFTGNWAGYRDRFADAGVIPFASAESDMAGNPLGGISRGFARALSIEAGARLDLEKLAGWQNARLTLRFIERTGDSLTERRLGNFFPVQQDYGVETFMVQNIALSIHFPDARLAWKIGRIAMGDDFATSDTYHYYMTNSIQGTPKALTNTNAFSCYPGSVWGTRLRWNPAPNNYVQAGLYQVTDTLYDGDKHGVDFSWRKHDGLTLALETGITTDPDGHTAHYKAGAFISYYDQFQPLDTETTNINYGLYLHADKLLYRPDATSRRGLTAWAVLSTTPDQRINILPWQISAGLLYRGLIPSRTNDTTILGLSHAPFSNDYARRQVAAGQPDPSGETVLELGHQIRLAPFFYIQPNLQYIIQPYGRSDIRDPLVIGLRLGLTL